MNDFVKWLLKFTFQAILWVFLLSIRVEGRPLFTYANEVFVQNTVVETVDEELGDLWQRLSKTAKATFDRTEPDEEKAM